MNWLFLLDLPFLWGDATLWRLRVNRELSRAALNLLYLRTKTSTVPGLLRQLGCDGRTRLDGGRLTPLRELAMEAAEMGDGWTTGLLLAIAKKTPVDLKAPQKRRAAIVTCLLQAAYRGHSQLVMEIVKRMRFLSCFMIQIAGFLLEVKLGKSPAFEDLKRRCPGKTRSVYFIARLAVADLRLIILQGALPFVINYLKEKELTSEVVCFLGDLVREPAIDEELWLDLVHLAYRHCEECQVDECMKRFCRLGEYIAQVQSEKVIDRFFASLETHRDGLSHCFDDCLISFFVRAGRWDLVERHGGLDRPHVNSILSRAVNKHNHSRVFEEVEKLRIKDAGLNASLLRAALKANDLVLAERLINEGVDLEFFPKVIRGRISPEAIALTKRYEICHMIMTTEVAASHISFLGCNIDLLEFTTRVTGIPSEITSVSHNAINFVRNRVKISEEIYCLIERLQENEVPGDIGTYQAFEVVMAMILYVEVPFSTFKRVMECIRLNFTSSEQLELLLAAAKFFREDHLRYLILQTRFDSTRVLSGLLGGVYETLARFRDCKLSITRVESNSRSLLSTAVFLIDICGMDSPYLLAKVEKQINEGPVLTYRTAKKLGMSGSDEYHFMGETYIPYPRFGTIWSSYGSIVTPLDPKSH